MKPLSKLGRREREVVADRRRGGYRRERLERFGDVEPTLRALLERLLPGVPASIDLAGFVDAHAGDPLGRGDREPGIPPIAELLARGLRALDARGFAQFDERAQNDTVRRLRHGDLDEELGLPAKEFVDRLLWYAVAGYLAHPDTWERIGFNGPAYPYGYAWISPRTVQRRHERYPGAARL